MATIRSVLGIFCLTLCWGFGQPSRNFLNQQSPPRLKPLNAAAAAVLAVAKSQLGVREATGHNDGTQVEQYLAYTGNRKGDPWCAAFVSWVFGQAGYTAPRTAWSPALFPKSRLTTQFTPATVFGLYMHDKQRIAHAGFVESSRGNWVYTLEGNTNVSGGREGDGVYRKLRHVKTIAALANWLPEEGGQP